jgi:hypothetical protein
MALQIPDQTIALQAKAPDGMQSISNMLNIATAAQALKKAKATYDSDVSQRASESSSADSNAQVNRANVQPLIDQQIASTSSAKTGAESAAYRLHGDYANTMLQTAAGAMKDPRITGANDKYDPAAAGQALSEAFDQARAKGVPTDQALLAIAPFMNKVHEPGAVATMLQNTVLGQMQAPSQAQAIAPSGVGVSNGQQSAVINTNPFAGQVGQAIPGTQQQMQLPPTTPTMDASGTPGYLGPQPAMQPGQQQPGYGDGFDPTKVKPEVLTAIAAQHPKEFAQAMIDFAHRGQQQGQQQAPQRVTSGLPIGASDAVQGTQGEINKHWGETQAAAGSAQQNIGILQNIKQHAAGAATGVGAERQALVQGLAGMLGMDSEQLARTDTDLLAKNANMLALAGGNTDSARALASAANPNNHMTKEAIAMAADQVIGQQKLALARAQFLAPHKAMADQGHPEAYIAARNQFNSVADPRVIQFTSMTPEEKIAMKSSMSEKERAEFGAKLAKARQLGIAQ